MLDHPVRARLHPDGYQVVHVVVDGGYRPDAIIARAGIPIQLVFRRDDDDACTERVVFSGPRLDRRLAPTGTTTVHLPAQPPGLVRFTCGMGRYRGRIEFVEARSPSVVARFRDRASRLKTPVGAALVLWIGSLPLIAIVAVLAFDATTAVAAAGAALIAWMAGCLWAFGRSASTA